MSELGGKSFIVLFFCVVSACGGGGGGGGDSLGNTPPDPTLRNATDLVDFANRFSTCSDADKATYVQYKYGFEDLPDAIVYANGTKPVEADSQYLAYASPNVTVPPVYPTPIAQEFLDPGPYPRVFGYRNKDLVNGTTTEGTSNAYYGVKDAVYLADGSLQVDAMFLQDEIVSVNGKPVYRGERTIIGHFCPVNVDCGFGIVATFPGEYFVGHMKNLLTEFLDFNYFKGTNAARCQIINEYDVIRKREDMPGASTPS